MRKNGLGKLYDRLTPKERFRLVVEAEARGDEGESRQLIQSAPRYTYEQAHPAYTNLVKTTKALCWEEKAALDRFYELYEEVRRGD